MVNRRYQVFVSSTHDDLVEERKAIADSILKCDCFPAGMELFPASNKTQWDIIKRVIDDSDIYLVIIAGKYGTITEDENGNEVSYTEMEFDYALNNNKPILALIYDNIDSLPGSKIERKTKPGKMLEEFRKKAKTGRMVAFWKNKDELVTKAILAINGMKSDGELKLNGWVPANSNVSEEDLKELESLKREKNHDRKLIERYQKEIKEFEDKIDNYERFMSDCFDDPNTLNDKRMKASVEESIKNRELKKQEEEQEYLEGLARINQERF